MNMHIYDKYTGCVEYYTACNKRKEKKTKQNKTKNKKTQ